MHIRPFKPSDINAVTAIMASSFTDKFAKISVNDLEAFLLAGNIVSKQSFEGYFVMEVQDQVAGVLSLQWAGQRRPPFKPDLKKLFQYGLINLIKFGIILLLLEEKPKKGECYVEYLAVSPKMRGMGLGTLLLKEGERFALEHGFKQYTLCVAANNEGAIKLYQRLGFTTQKTKSSLLTQYFFGNRDWHHMALKDGPCVSSSQQEFSAD